MNNKPESARTKLLTRAEVILEAEGGLGDVNKKRSGQQVQVLRWSKSCWRLRAG